MTLDDLAARLHGEGRLRVWSLAVTVFGDAIAPRGGSIAMADLSAILERLGAEPGAIRTAMSRLARDGIVSRTELDTAIGDLEVARARVELEEARVESARIRLGYTEIHAPIDGRPVRGKPVKALSAAGTWLNSSVCIEWIMQSSSAISGSIVQRSENQWPASPS